MPKKEKYPWTQAEIDQLRNAGISDRAQAVTAEKHADYLEHELKKTQLRLDAVLYSLVMCQEIIRSRETKLRQYEKKYGDMSLAV